MVQTLEFSERLYALTNSNLMVLLLHSPDRIESVESQPGESACTESNQYMSYEPVVWNTGTRKERPIQCMPSEAHARLSHMHPVRLVLLQILKIKSIKISKTCCSQTAPTLRISAQPQLQCSMFQLCCSQTTLTAGIPGSAEAFCPKLASRWDAIRKWLQ